VHSYSLDIDIRKGTYILIGALSLLISSLVIDLGDYFGIQDKIKFSISFGVAYGVLYWLLNSYLWKLKWLSPIIKIPDLNGNWDTKGISSYKDPKTGKPIEYDMVIKIKQTFSRIEVFAETETSTSKSFMARIEVEHAVPMFIYAFDNTPKNTANEELQRHPGLVSLRIEERDKMSGDYFSGKHRLRFGEMTLIRKGNR